MGVTDGRTDGETRLCLLYRFNRLTKLYRPTRASGRLWTHTREPRLLVGV